MSENTQLKQHHAKYLYGNLKAEEKQSVQQQNKKIIQVSERKSAKVKPFRKILVYFFFWTVDNIQSQTAHITQIIVFITKEVMKGFAEYYLIHI